MRVEGTLIFSNAIMCASGVLGSEHRVKINGIEGTLALPRLPENFQKENTKLLPPQNADLRIPLNPRNWTGVSSYMQEWGKTIKWPEGHSTVRAARLWFPIEGSSDSLENMAVQIGSQVHKGLTEWVNIFEECIEVLTSQDLSGHPEVEAESVETDFWIVNEHDNTLTPAQEPSRQIRMFMRGASYNAAANINQFSTAVGNASIGIRPKLEYILIRDALRAALWNECRRCILDASSASEVALTNKAQSLLDVSTINRNLSKAIMEKYQGLNNRLTLCRLLGVQLPNVNFNKDLIEPRNLVAHRGKKPNHTEAITALNAASALVEAVCPSKFES